MRTGNRKIPTFSFSPVFNEYIKEILSPPSEVVTKSFYYAFRQCFALTYIPKDFFKFNPEAINLEYCFSSCTHIYNIPNDLLDPLKNVVNLDSALNGVGNFVGNFIRIKSRNVTNANYILYGVQNATTVYVPANSTTYNTFANAQGKSFTLIAE